MPSPDTMYSSDKDREGVKVSVRKSIKDSLIAVISQRLTRVLAADFGLKAGFFVVDFMI